MCQTCNGRRRVLCPSCVSAALFGVSCGRCRNTGWMACPTCRVGAFRVATANVILHLTGYAFVALARRIRPRPRPHLVEHDPLAVFEKFINGL